MAKKGNSGKQVKPGTRKASDLSFEELLSEILKVKPEDIKNTLKPTTKAKSRGN